MTTHGCSGFVRYAVTLISSLSLTIALRITFPDVLLTPTTSTNSRFVNTKPSTKALQVIGPIFKWEKRKRSSDSYAPSVRSGCTMALWAAKGTGVLFGGVTDEDTSEEVLESMFWNDM